VQACADACILLRIKLLLLPLLICINMLLLLPSAQLSNLPPLGHLLGLRLLRLLLTELLSESEQYCSQHMTAAAAAGTRQGVDRLSLPSITQHLPPDRWPAPPAPLHQLTPGMTRDTRDCSSGVAFVTPSSKFLAGKVTA